MQLYLHIPFCRRRCSYCDFAIAVRRETPSAEFVAAALHEWRQRRAEPEWAGRGPLTTVYLGGGTPSRLAPQALAHLLETFSSEGLLTPGAEVTLEANPEDVTAATAGAWRRAGVNRVSLGVQSFDPDVLAWMHRTHDAEQVPSAVVLLREAGFENLSLDLIYGLPADLARDWSRDLERALALEPEHLSLYGLTVEKFTPLGRWVARGVTRPASDERGAEEFLNAHRRLTAAGLRHYEVSNYARPGREAVHNRGYWRRAPFLGIGPSAHSGAGARRWWNIRDWTEWRRTVETKGSALAGSEELGPEAVALEDLYLGLRTDEGAPATLIPPEHLTAWTAEGWAVEEGAQVRLTPEGWLRLDALVASSGRP
jgi:putative oxygen-independent coproporphyrinogen III oxidase